MPTRHLTLFQRLTWRFALLGLREWLVLAIAVLAIVGYGIFMAGHGGICSGEQTQLQLELEQSDRDIAATAADDRAGRCSVFRHRRDLLAKAAEVMGRCGSGRSVRGSFDFLSGRAAEKGFYDSLVVRQCGAGGSD